MALFNVSRFTEQTVSRSVCGYFEKFSEKPHERTVGPNPPQFDDLKIHDGKRLKRTHIHKANSTDTHLKPRH